MKIEMQATNDAVRAMDNAGFWLFMIAMLVTCGWSPRCGCDPVSVVRPADQ